MVNKVQLRSWQREAFSIYEEQLSQGCNTSLWEATPGAGKTTAALEVIKHQLRSKRAQFAVVIVPTAHLRVQWARAAQKVGIQLDSNFNGNRKGLTRDFNGIIVTYQFLRNEKLLKELAAKSVVILDEVHHAADGLTWGDTLRSILVDARYILCLSGTPFRSDCNPIPFVKYDRAGVSTPDYSYSFTKAVEEGVCRPTAFFTYGGEISWGENGKVTTVNFSDTLDTIGSARRLRAALEPEAGWIQPMLKDAHEALLEIRKNNSAPGGLIVCADQNHAREIGKLISSISGEKAVVVLSDDRNSSKKIKAFSEGTALWLVACNMVSEGIDIPRLCIGVYATTVRTKMYFRQFLGRVVRRQPNLKAEQVAYVYLPADPTLRILAEEVENEVRHNLTARSSDWEERPESLVDRPERKEPTWTAIGGTNSGIDAVIVSGSQLSLFGGEVKAERLHEVVKKEIEIRQEEKLTRSEYKAQLCSDIRSLVGLAHRKSGKSHSAIHTSLNKAQAVRSQTHCTEEQLVKRKILLEELISA